LRAQARAAIKRAMRILAESLPIDDALLRMPGART
jgi:hypothetical protein